MKKFLLSVVIIVLITSCSNSMTPSQDVLKQQAFMSVSLSWDQE